VLAKRIIPCLDVRDGRTVKGVNFVNLRDAGDAVELAKTYSDKGADELVFLDITATVEKRKTLTKLVKNISKAINIPFTVGGGINTIEDVDALLSCGADKISINSICVKNPTIITDLAKTFGSQCVVCALDVKRNVAFSKNGLEGWEIYTHGGRVATGLDAFDFARDVYNRGAGEILLTSMDSDGCKNGFSLDLTSRISKSVSIPVIASGGAGNMEHFRDVFTTGCADAALAASIFHFGEVEIKDLKRYLDNNNISVRQ
jgi:cyclase